MSLTPERLAEIRARLSERGRSYVCSECGESDWRPSLEGADCTRAIEGCGGTFFAGPFDDDTNQDLADILAALDEARAAQRVLREELFEVRNGFAQLCRDVDEAHADRDAAVLREREACVAAVREAYDEGYRDGVGGMRDGEYHVPDRVVAQLADLAWLSSDAFKAIRARNTNPTTEEA